MDHLHRLHGLRDDAPRPTPAECEDELALQRDLIAVALWQTLKAHDGGRETRAFRDLPDPQRAYWRDQAEIVQAGVVGALRRQAEHNATAAVLAFVDDETGPQDLAREAIERYREDYPDALWRLWRKERKFARRPGR